VNTIEFRISAALSGATESTPEKIPVIRMSNISPIGDLITDDQRFLEVSARKRADLSLVTGDLILIGEIRQNGLEKRRSGMGGWKPSSPRFCIVSA
jgi:hypothetical protein